MAKWTFVSKPRIIFTGMISALFVFYVFNFVPRNINIIASRSLERQIFGYVLNFVLFFIAIYILFSVYLLIYIKSCLNAKNKLFLKSFSVYIKTVHHGGLFLICTECRNRTCVTGFGDRRTATVRTPPSSVATDITRR